MKLAQTEVGAELEAATQRPGNVYFTEGSGWQSSGGETNLSRIDLNNIVVTPPLKLWHTFQTLAIAYRDAYNRKLNDKYLPKWKEYKELARWAADLLFQTGIGITTTPIPRTPLPTLDWVSSTLGAMALFVRTTWVNANSAEGAGSVEQAISVPSGNAIRVTPANAPSGVTGWNVYVGEASGKATRQNSQPLDLGTPWSMPGSGLVAGESLGNGQEAEVFKTVPRFLSRG